MRKKGQIPWNKGLTKDTDERVKKNVEASGKTQKEKYVTGELVSWKKGKTTETDGRIKPQTQEHKDNISKALKELFSDKENRHHGLFGEHPVWNTGLHIVHSPESNAKRSATMKGKKKPPFTDEHKKNISLVQTGVKETPEAKEHRKELCEIRKKNGWKMWNNGLTKFTDERIMNGAIKAKEKYANGEFETFAPHKFYKSGYSEYLGHRYRSSWEFEICNILRDNYIMYEYEKKRFRVYYDDGSYKVYTPDLYFQHLKLFIEIKGYWNEDNFEKTLRFADQHPEYKILVIDGEIYDKIIQNKEAITNEKELLNYIN